MRACFGIFAQSQHFYLCQQEVVGLHMECSCELWAISSADGQQRQTHFYWVSYWGVWLKHVTQKDYFSLWLICREDANLHETNTLRMSRLTILSVLFLVASCITVILSFGYPPQRSSSLVDLFNIDKYNRSTLWSHIFFIL